MTNLELHPETRGDRRHSDRFPLPSRPGFRESKILRAAGKAGIGVSASFLVAASAFLGGCQRPVANARPQIAISRFELPVAVVRPWWTSIQTDFLHDKLIGALVHDGSLAVVERARLDAIVGEQSLTRKEITDPAAAAALGKMLGARYFVFGKLVNLDIDTKTQALPYSDRSETLVNGKVRVDFRIVDVETSEVLASESEETVDHLREVTAKDDSVERLRERLTDRCAANIAQRISAVLDPPRILSVDEKGIELTRGGGAPLFAGQALEVFEPAAPGRPGLAAGRRVALINVVSLTPTGATARLVEGGGVVAGSGCMALPEAPPPPPPPRADPLKGQW